MKKVVVIGAGYGGLRAIEKLVKLNNIEITIIDQNSFHYLQTDTYGYIAGKFDICDITVDIQSFAAGLSPKVKFIHEKVINIITAKNSVVTSSLEIPYDELIIATGARTNFPEFILGLKDNSKGIKVLDRAFEFKSEFENIIYKKVINHEQKEFNIVIGGAGLSGVETAAEMAYIAKKFTKSIGIKESRIHINLVEAYDTILNGMSEFIIKNSMKRLKKLGVNVMLNSFIEHVDKDKMRLKNGTVLQYDFMIFTGGIKVNPLDMDISYETNRLGQYLVTKHLQLNDLKNVYAIGDCTELKDIFENILPPTAQTAEQSAEYVVKHIKSKDKHQIIKPYHGQIEGMFVALGGKYAVGEAYDSIRFKGYSAYLIKRLITKMYHFGLKLKFNNSFTSR